MPCPPARPSLYAGVAGVILRACDCIHLRERERERRRRRRRRKKKKKKGCGLVNEGLVAGENAEGCKKKLKKKY
jgi:hypothetical protein